MIRFNFIKLQKVESNLINFPITQSQKVKIQFEHRVKQLAHTPTVADFETLRQHCFEFKKINKTQTKPKISCTWGLHEKKFL